MENQNQSLLKVQTLARNLDMGVSTIWSLTKQGKFPKPLKISSQMTRWKKSDIDAWLENPSAWEGK